MGGAFDPIHLGHVNLALHARRELGLGVVLFIPSGDPPHKAYGLADSASRMEMVGLALEGHEGLTASDAEVARKGKSYAVDTLRELRGAYGGARPLTYIIGADIVGDLPTWKDAREVFGMCRFACAMRPGYGMGAALAAIGSLREAYGADISVFECPMVEASSSSIRRLISEGRMDLAKDSLHPAVAGYIAGKGLYGPAVRL